MSKKSDEPMLLDGIPPKTIRPPRAKDDESGAVSAAQIERLRDLELFIPGDLITSRYSILTRRHANEVIGEYERYLIQRDKEQA